MQQQLTLSSAVCEMKVQCSAHSYCVIARKKERERERNEIEREGMHLS
jgi:hypothetical protein